MNRVLLLAAGAAALGAATRPAAAAADSDLVMMQQMVVEASHTDWKYLSCPGYEVLSHCDDSDTRWFSTGFFRCLALQDELVPAHFFPAQTVPLTAILYNRKASTLERCSNLVPSPIKLNPATGTAYGPLQNVQLLTGIAVAKDRDTVALAANLWGTWDRVHQDFPPVIAGAGFIVFRLERRAPPPPPWFVAGLTQDYGLSRAIPTPPAMLIPAAVWVTPAEAQADLAAANARALAAARQSVHAAPSNVVAMQAFVTTDKSRMVLLPMQEIFRERRREDGPPSKLWQAQSALFVRWGYFGETSDPQHRANFLHFLARAQSEPIAEPIFQACFGFGYAEAEARLAAYLPLAQRDVAYAAYRFTPHWPPRSPQIVRRTATEVEVARIVGDWERMTGVQLKKSRPELAALYLKHAGETLLRPYRTGSRDPRLMVVLGMYYKDAGDDTNARTLLEAALQAGAIRPAAGFMLSQLRLADAEAHPAAPGQKLSAEQSAAILRPMLGSEDPASWSLPRYALLREVLAREADRPTAEQIALLAQGVRLFPRSSRFVQAAAQTAGDWGYPTAEADFLAAGIPFADDASMAEFDAMLKAAR